MMRATTVMLLILVWIVVPTFSFQRHVVVTHKRGTGLNMVAGFFGGGGSPRIPSSPSDRDNQAIQAVKAAMDSPRTPSFRLIECEFPPLAALNKLGDGSLRSATQVDDANLDFCLKLVKSIAPPLPMLGPRVWVLVSSTATNSFLQKATTACNAGMVHCLKDGLPNVRARDVCVLIAPSGRDYQVAQQLVDGGYTVVLVNGFAKDAKSVSGEATMAYFLKPLTYNSQVAGYLVRSWPGQWTTIDATTKQVLGTFADSDILVSGTNTPDLRDAVRQVQKSVDERAIKARQS